MHQALICALVGAVATTATAQDPEWPVAVDEGAIPEPIAVCYGNHTSGAAIETAPDVDTYVFEGLAGDVVHIRVDGQTNNFDPRVEVYDDSFALIGESNCGAGTFATCSLELVVTLDAAGEHLMIVSDSGSNNTGAYALSIERIPSPYLMRHLENGASISGVVSPPTDSDLYTFEASAGSVMRFTLAGHSNNYDAWLGIVDEAGTLLDAASCSASTFGTCSISPLTYSFTEDGTYTVVVEDNGADNSGSYTVSRTCLLGPCPEPVWANTGSFLAGVAGAPVASGFGEFTADGQVEVRLDRAAPDTTAFLVFGTGESLVPFKGGTLVPLPQVVSPALPTSADGTVLRFATLPSDTPAGLEFVLQFWIIDPSNPQGWAASNALVGTSF